MVAKRYTIAGILGVAAFVGTCSNGFADKDRICTATCEKDYVKEHSSCPPLKEDARAYFRCVEKAENREDVCDHACPNASGGTIANGNANANKKAPVINRDLN
jgi:hypothetical protein